MKINIPTLLTGGLVGITACSGLVLASATTHADNDSVTDDVNITVPIACTMTGTIVSGQEHTATLQPGTYSGASSSSYENGIGKTTLTAHCNDYNGFSIYVIGFTGETEGDNTLVGTSASSGATIPTKVYESTDTTSNWSMKVTKVTDSSATFNPNNMTITNSFDSWHTVPDDYTKVAEYHASTGSSATDQSLGAKIETTYASYISTTQPAGTYTGKVKYVMVHPYDATAPEIPEDDPNACNTPVPNLTYMQDLNNTNKATVLASMTEDAQYFLKDKRDEKSYCVAKLKDGNIWMTQNLDHNIDKTYNYTNENTDIGWNSSTSSYDTESWTPVASTHVTDDTEWHEYDETSNPDGGDEWHAESYDAGNQYWNGELYNHNPQESSYYISSSGLQNYHLGNYYNWAASVATNDINIYGYDEATGEYVVDFGESVDRSICPSGWMLPKDSDHYSNIQSFTNLLEQYGWDEDTLSSNISVWDSPLLYTLSGSFDGVYNNMSKWGTYWTSTMSSPDDPYAIMLEINDDGNTWLYNAPPTGVGRSIRCLAR